MEKYASHYPERRGLSLIELMVSVAVIAILASVVVAAIGNSTASASKAASSSRLRSCFMAFQGYAAEHNGAILPAFESFEGHTGIRATFGSRLIDGGYLDGPYKGEKALGCDVQRGQFNYEDAPSFGMNGRIGRYQPSSTIVPAGPQSFADVVRPDKMGLLMHGIWGGAAFNAAVYEARYANEALPVFGDRVLILFADGSVDARIPASVPTERSSDEGRAFWLGNF